MPGIRRLKVNHVGEILLKCCTGQYMVFMYVPGHDNRHVVAIRDNYVFDSTGLYVMLIGLLQTFAKYIILKVLIWLK